jgi:hypothetical protein
MERLTKANVDLQKFIEKFKPERYKLLERGLEIRGVIDMHGAIAQAKVIIARLGLKLKILHTAEMLTYRGFEVTYL